MKWTSYTHCESARRRKKKTKSLSNLRKELDIQIKDLWLGWTEKAHLRNVTIKLSKVKDSRLEGQKKSKKENIDNSKKKQITFKEIHIKIISTLFCRNIKSRREWDDIVKVLKKKNLPTEMIIFCQLSLAWKRN